MRVVKNFKDYLPIDGRLRERTVERHMLEMKRLFRIARFDPFKFPSYPFRAVTIPSKEEFQSFYRWLRSP